MTIEAGKQRGRRTWTLAAVITVALPILVGTLLSVLLVSNQHYRVRLEADAAVRAGVAAAVVPIVAELQRELADAARRASGPDASGRGGGTLPVGDVQDRPDLLSSTLSSRDSGRPVLLDLAQPPAVLAPVYRTGRVPEDTAGRRDAITGYRLVPLALGPVVSGLLPAGGGLVVRGPHREAIAAPGPMPAVKDRRSFATALHLPETRGWVVEGWVPDPAPRAVAWLGVLVLLALSGGLSAAGACLRRRSIAAARDRARLHRQRALVSGMAPVVQSSLDLGEVAPAVSAHLVHALALQGISLSAPSAAGERPLFLWGVPPDAAVVPGRGPRARLEPGETFAVSLTRGGRILGVLRVVAGETLLRGDLDALATATELLASTLSHVEIFARQQQIVERLRAVDELKTVFLATASHELRTPVTAIVGFSALLLDEWDEVDSAQGRMFMDRVLSNARELESLIEQLLDFSRLERGVQPEDHEILDLGETIAEILAGRAELVSDHELRADLAPGCVIRGSRAALDRIVTNLVGNATKYSPAGTQIEVAVRRDGGQVTLTVDDEGPGVSAEDREHIFSRFYRGHGGPVTSTRGACIGLAIVAEYAASMDGTATVAQAPAGGARFTLHLPSAEEAVVAPGKPLRNGAPRVPIA